VYDRTVSPPEDRRGPGHVGVAVAGEGGDVARRLRRGGRREPALEQVPELALQPSVLEDRPRRLVQPVDEVVVLLRHVQRRRVRVALLPPVVLDVRRVVAGGAGPEVRLMPNSISLSAGGNRRHSAGVSSFVGSLSKKLGLAQSAHLRGRPATKIRPIRRTSPRNRGGGVRISWGGKAPRTSQKEGGPKGGCPFLGRPKGMVPVRMGFARARPGAAGPACAGFRRHRELDGAQVGLEGQERRLRGAARRGWRAGAWAAGPRTASAGSRPGDRRPGRRSAARSCQR
jgi:hypothetical protein